MKKVLIAAGDLKTGEHYQRVLSQSGFQTALVWNSIQMVDFCRQNDPDTTVIDLDLAGPALWNGLQAIKGMGALANMPVIGIGTAGDASAFAEARQAGVNTVLPKEEGPEGLSGFLTGAMKPNESFIPPKLSSEPKSENPVTANFTSTDRGQAPAPANESSITRLTKLIHDIQTTTENLKARIPEFGEEGPELFGYIVGSGEDIRAKLSGIGETSLYDHDLRHDFRNMIGSVTGFAELILMEPGLSPESKGGLTHLRECSRDFVEILDQQKALAEA